MAEGFAKSILGDSIRAASAGLDLKELNQLAVRVMAEVAVDIGEHQPRTIDFALPPEDEAPALVITMCSQAAESCPPLPAETACHNIEIDDPTSLADGAGAITEDQVMPYYHQVRDKIAAFIENDLPGLLEKLVTDVKDQGGSSKAA